eukprot:CAMPEP_0118875862 /NCGR_PEP_ID=MMETSP1163-20130328/16761_1 /TAXON_ID=124430 /ORGANISM="Phaeomonas parva, Strain CCMP2877" /LENGTH=459 /DNA_ID=CAMNT_0006811411 /DNA_START=206 /DNA_END=1585 /DNA_ORIENTATION=-
MQDALALSEAAGLASALGGLALLRFNAEVPEPYMDEPFHLQQTQKYCAGDYDSWDPKITTFPGLYYAGVAVSKAYDLMGAEAGSACNLRTLRGVNCAFLVVSLCAMVLYYKKRGFASKSAVMHASVLACYAPHLFYHFMYYTDPGSTCFVLLMLLAAAHDRQVLASLLGVVGIGFRQNNVAWVAFVLGATVLRTLAATNPENKNLLGLFDAEPSLGNFGLVLKAMWREKGALLGATWAYLLPLGGFAAFLLGNGGSVVVGDKANHTMVPHLAMLGYFFAIVWLPYGLAGPSGVFSKSTLNEIWFLFTATPAALLCVIGGGSWLLAKYSFSHPFLLADNRHLTFYLWKGLLAKPQARLLLGAAYCVAGILGMRRLSRCQGFLFSAGFLATTALVLVPAHLLELRYFTLPVLIYHLHAPQRPPTAVYLAVALNAALSLGLGYVFLYRPFEDANGVTQRFML